MLRHRPLDVKATLRSVKALLDMNEDEGAEISLEAAEALLGSENADVRRLRRHLREQRRPTLNS